MQERHMDELMKHSFSEQSEVDPKAFADLLSKQMKDETNNLPLGTRTLYSSEIEEIVAFMQQYKKQSPGASKRRIREAAKKHFKIIMLPNS